MSEINLIEITSKSANFTLTLVILGVLISVVLLMAYRLYVIIMEKEVAESIVIYEREIEGTKLVEYDSLQQENKDREFVNVHSVKGGFFDDEFTSKYIYREPFYKYKVVLNDCTVFNVEEELERLKSKNPNKDYVVEINLINKDDTKDKGTITNDYLNAYIKTRKQGLNIKKVILSSTKIEEHHIIWE